MSPAFSPDGRWIAFASIERRGIFRVPAIGGPVQRLTEFGVQPAWSPDGQTIVFRSSGASSLSTTDYYWPAESSLWTVPAAGGPSVQITGVNGQPAGGQSFPSFSPDGAEIRFLNDFKGEASIWAYRIADKSLRKLFASERFPYSNPTFAGDGTRMWFVDWRLNGNIAIWQLPLDPATLTPVGEPEPLPSSFAVPRDLTLSADGTRLAFTGVLPTSAVLTQELSANPAPPVSLTRETTYRYGLVRSSPDGTRVAYTSFPRNGVPRVWVVNADGSQPVSIGPTETASNFGSLSPDNSLVFFIEILTGERRIGASRKTRVSRQSLSDGASTPMSDLPAGANQIACSLNCTHVVFHNDVLDERRRLYVQDAATGAHHVIASGQDDVGFGRFSRDDKWISVEITDRRTGGDSIAVLPAGGGPLNVILKSDQPSFASGWMDDNDRVLFAGFRSAAWNIYTVSRTTGAVERLTSYTSMRTYVRYPDWLAGNRVVYEFNETKGNIFVASLARR
jgi:Tol biopolymer transport system component